MTRFLLAGVLLFAGSGCALQEVRSKSTFGPEFRSRGRGSARTADTKWTAQQGFEFKWDKGITTGLTYRERNVDHGTADREDGVWFDFSFPVWKAKPKPDAKSDRVEALERRIAQMEAERKECAVSPTVARTDAPAEGNGTN